MGEHDEQRPQKRSERGERLRAALRENLRRRKAQARGRRDAEPAAPEPCGPAPGAGTPGTDPEER